MKEHFSNKKLNIFFLGLIITIQLSMCLPHVGKGFISDDFIWLDNALRNGKPDYIKPFTDSTGFFRPLVGVTFGIQYYFHGMNTRPYGIFNLIIHTINIILIYWFVGLFKSLKKFAIPIALLFSLNIKSNPMAIGWISGRTTLMFSFFSLISLVLLRKTATSLRKKKYVLYFLVNVFFLAALLSKETAIMIPVLVFLFVLFFETHDSGSIFSRGYRAIKSLGIFMVPLGIYFFFRIKTHAFTPFNAPESYSFEINPFLFLKNFWEYFFRAGLFDFFIMIWLLILIAAKWKKFHGFTLDFQQIYAGMTWFMVFLLPVLFLNVRSNLYVYLPQIGIHLMLIFLMVYLWRLFGIQEMGTFSHLVAIFPVLILLGVWLFLLAGKTSAYGREGDESRFFVQEIVRSVPRLPKHGYLYVFDTEKILAESPRKTVSYGFNSLLRLLYSYPYKKLSGEIIVPNGFAKINRIRKSDRFFFWYGKHLIGPFDGVVLRDLISGLSFIPINFPEIKIKTKEKAKKNLTRFQKRKLGLKQLKKLKQSGAI